MRDVFYTILVVWIIWRIIASVNTVRSKAQAGGSRQERKPGETTIDHVPPQKKRMSDIEGEYVDYEEVDL